jgi:type IV secretion system protein VirB9
MCVVLPIQTQAARPIVSDSRIKTLVFSESEVFKVILHYGYQSNIEFAKNESVETISMGNNYAWQVTPVGNRIFLKPLEPEAHTNMTVITNERTYQFDISSRLPEKAGIDEELVYVVRFYYPENEDFDAPPPAPGAERRRLSPDMLQARKGMNFDYTLSGPDSFAPLKVFDDGGRTHFEFPNSNANIPYIFIVNADGSEQRLTFSREGGYIVVPRVGAQFMLRLGPEVVCVFNERMAPVSVSPTPSTGTIGGSVRARR